MVDEVIDGPSDPLISTRRCLKVLPRVALQPNFPSAANAVSSVRLSVPRVHIVEMADDLGYLFGTGTPRLCIKGGSGPVTLSLAVAFHRNTEDPISFTAVDRLTVQS